MAWLQRPKKRRQSRFSLVHDEYAREWVSDLARRLAVHLPLGYELMLHVERGFIISQEQAITDPNPPCKGTILQQRFANDYERCEKPTSEGFLNLPLGR